MAANTFSGTVDLQGQNKSLLDTLEKLRLKVSTLEDEIKTLKEGMDSVWLVGASATTRSCSS